jgi:hypothetical protein
MPTSWRMRGLTLLPLTWAPVEPGSSVGHRVVVPGLIPVPARAATNCRGIGGRSASGSAPAPLGGGCRSMCSLPEGS